MTDELLQPLPVSTLVLGACGGAGATTTALGLANTAAVRGGAVVAVDATPAGGDVAERGADAVLSVSGLEQVVAASAAGPVADDVFDGYCSRTSAGTRILNRIGNKTAMESEFHTLTACSACPRSQRCPRPRAPATRRVPRAAPDHTVTHRSRRAVPGGRLQSPARGVAVDR